MVVSSRSRDLTFLIGQFHLMSTFGARLRISPASIITKVFDLQSILRSLCPNSGSVDMHCWRFLNKWRGVTLIGCCWMSVVRVHLSWLHPSSCVTKQFNGLGARVLSFIPKISCFDQIRARSDRVQCVTGKSYVPIYGKHPINCAKFVNWLVIWTRRNNDSTWASQNSRSTDRHCNIFKIILELSCGKLFVWFFHH